MMLQEFDSTISAAPSISYPWYEVWWRAITKPSVETYLNLLNDPTVSIKRATVWVFISLIIGSCIHLISFMLLFQIYDYDIRDLLYIGEYFYVLFPVTLVVLGLLGWIFRAAINQFIAELMGGNGTFIKLAYLFAAILAPYYIVYSIIELIPCLNCLALPLGIYMWYLDVVAIKTINELSWGRSIATYLISLCMIIVSIVCVAMIIIYPLLMAIGSS